MQNKVFFNGKLILSNQARLEAGSPGTRYGWGVFETLRLSDNKSVLLSKHLRRLRRSSKVLGIQLKYSSYEITKTILNLISINHLKDARIRICVWKNKIGADFYIEANSYQPIINKKYKEGIGLILSPQIIPSFSMLTEHKTANYLFHQLVYNWAKNRGFDDALIINEKGDLVEVTRGNIFFISKHRLYTPKLSCGCLPGVTREAVINLAKKIGIKVEEGNFSVKELFAAQEIFFTNSLIGIMPVKKIKGSKIVQIRTVFNLTVTERLQKVYLKLWKKVS